MNLFDRAVLLLTGLTAIYLTWRFYQDSARQSTKPLHNMYYMVSFAVLLVSGLLLIALGWEILPHPFVIVVTTFLPLGISAGLYQEFHADKAKGYLGFAIVGFLAIVLTRFIPGVSHGFQVITLIIVHTIAGLSIFFIPIFAVKAGNAPSGFIFVTVGGALIGLGGMALAFLKSGAQLLFFSAEFVMLILAPLLLLMTLAYTWGFMKKIAASK